MSDTESREYAAEIMGASNETLCKYFGIDPSRWLITQISGRCGGGKALLNIVELGALSVSRDELLEYIGRHGPLMTQTVITDVSYEQILFAKQARRMRFNNLEDDDYEHAAVVHVNELKS